MKTKKKILSMLISMGLILSLTACGEEKSKETTGLKDSTSVESTSNVENETDSSVVETTTTEEPATEELTTEEPATEEPTTQEPTTQKPTIEEPTTQKPSKEDTSSIDEFSTIEEIKTYITEKTWYSPIIHVESEFYNELTFHTDGTFELKIRYNDDPKITEESGTWTLSEDKTLEIYFAADDIDKLVWGDVTSKRDNNKWKIDGNTVKIYGDNYSLTKPEFSEIKY